MREIILIAALVAIISACANPISQKKAGIKLEVNGELWKSVSSLKDSTSDDNHYVVRTDEDGAVVIIFGDGKHGAIPTRGKNIKVTFTTRKRYIGVYRQQGRVLTDDDWNENNGQSESFNEHCQ